MDAGTQTIASFTGTLLRREHNVGQKFVQLVFREGGKNWLCISSKITDTKLAIGQNYRIEGIVKQAGEKGFIVEPKIMIAKRHIPVKRLAIVAGIVTVIATVGGVAFAAQQHASTPSMTPVKHTAATINTAPTAATTTETQPVQQAPAATTTTPAPSTATTTSKMATAKAAAAKNSSTSGASNTSNVGSTPATTPVSTAFCETVEIPVEYSYVDLTADPNAVLSDGTAGRKQICYDDSAKSNPVTQILTQMVPGVKASVS